MANVNCPPGGCLRNEGALPAKAVGVTKNLLVCHTRSTDTCCNYPKWVLTDGLIGFGSSLDWPIPMFDPRAPILLGREFTAMATGSGLICTAQSRHRLAMTYSG